MSEVDPVAEPASPHRSLFALSNSPLLRLLRTREGQVGLALALLTIATFASVYSCDFVNFDDPLYITKNYYVQEGLRYDAVVWSFTTLDAGNWHPLTWLSLKLDVELFDGSAAGCHATNLALHVLNVLLLYSLLVRMTGSWPRPALVAALFAVHPLHVESVAWVSERKDVLSTFFGLLAVAAYLGYARRRSPGRYALLLLLYTASLLAKQMLVTLPFLLLLLDWWPLRRLNAEQQAAGADAQPPFPAVRLRWLLLEKLPLLGLALAACAVTIYAQHQGGAVVPLDHFPLSLRLANSLDSSIAYLRQTFWPTDLAVYYPFPISGIPPLRLAVDALLLFGVTALALYGARSRPYLLVGWLWYLGTLVPVIGLVQVGQQARADRYTYVPHIGLFIALVWGLSEILPRRRALVLSLTALVVLPPCVLRTHQQIGCWRNNLALWENTVAQTEDNTLARTNYAFTLQEMKREDEAADQWKEAVRIDPKNTVAQVALGQYYERHGRPNEALPYYRAALKVQPSNIFYQELVKKLDPNATDAPTPP